MNETAVKEFNLIDSLSTEVRTETALVTTIKNDDIFSLEQSAFDLPLRISTFSSSKEFEKFIKNVERIVRTSMEYRYWVTYIVENLNQKECVLTKETINECPVVIHHHPINLYTIVKTIINDEIRHQKEFSTFDIALKTIQLHYQNNVGYIVLISDLHEKYHSGFLQLPIELVEGNYKHLINTHQLEDEELQQIYQLCNVHKEDLKIQWSKNNYPGINK